ncbi:uncharacterized protein [Scyliorhinus torazame]|uniref:uncharacterized protein n=1 Tax=Scyliorhinus torazame TaxID=75743 RepID=UPI003B5A97A4
MCLSKNSPSPATASPDVTGIYAVVQDQLNEDYQTQLAWQQFCRSLTTENDAGQAPTVDTWTEDANSKLESECLESEVLENTPSGPLVQTAMRGRNCRRGTPKGSKWKLAVFVIVIVSYISGVSGEYCKLIQVKYLKCFCVPQRGYNVLIHSPAGGDSEIECSRSDANDVSCRNATIIEVQPYFIMLERSGDSPHKDYVCEKRFVTTDNAPLTFDGEVNKTPVSPETIPNNGTEPTPNLTLFLCCVLVLLVL